MNKPKKDVLVNAIEEGRTIRLIGREREFEDHLPDGFFVLSSDVSKFPHSWRKLIDDEGPRGYHHVSWPEPARGGWRGRLRHFRDEVFLKREITPLEADLDRVQRYLIDRGQIQFAPEWRILYFDLETTRVRDWDRPWDSRILSFSWRSSTGKSGHVRLAALTDGAERELLDTWVRLAMRHDVVFAWNGEKFDFPVLLSRCQVFDVPLDERLVHWIDHLELVKKYWQKSEDGGVMASFALNSIAEKYLKEERKVPISKLAVDRGWDGRGDLFVWVWEHHPDLLREYNCLIGHTPVVLADGSTKSIADIVNERDSVEVLSMTAFGEVVSRKVVGWHRVRVQGQKWLKIRSVRDGLRRDSRGLVCTPDHRVATNRGWVEASNLKIGDFIFLPEFRWSVGLRSALMGTLLGDSWLATSPVYRGELQVPSAHLQGGHVGDLSKIKSQVTRGFLKAGPSRNQTRGFGGSESRPLELLSSTSSWQFAELWPLYYDEDGRRLREEVLEQLGAVGLAWWFMDDGCLQKSKKDTVHLALCRYRDDDQVVARRWFERNFGPCSLHDGSLHFSRSATEKFAAAIAPHVFECCRYKLPRDLELPSYEPLEFTQLDTPITICVSSVEEYEPLRDTPSQRMYAETRYCLTVEGEHNFFTSFGLVKNCQDVALMEKLEAKTGFASLHFAMCRLCRVLPGKRSLYSMNLVDGKMLQRGRQTDYRFPTRNVFVEDNYRAKGAFVPEAQVGLHEGVAVVDFSKMYPSIIRTLNLSLETVDPKGDIVVPLTDEVGRRTGKEVARFRSTPEGHLPAALREMLDLRKHYDGLKKKAQPATPEFFDAERLSQAAKVLTNAFYGVVLSSTCRYYRREVGESVTTMGRLLLASTIGAAEKRGYKLVFGDTDSCAFVATDEQAKAFKDHVNADVIPPVVESTGVSRDRSEISIDYEKSFHRVLVTASKRYAAKLAIYKGKPAAPDAPIVVTGLEIVRTDVCVATRRLQRDFLERVLAGETAVSLYERALEIREKFVAGEWAPPEELVIAKSMTKRPSEYATKPLHVKIAERIMAAGLEVDVGGKVPYFLVKGRELVHPSEFEEGMILDYPQYWNRHVWNATERCLEPAFPQIAWGAVRFHANHDPNQLGLFSSAAVPTAKVQRKVVAVKRERLKVVLQTTLKCDHEALLRIVEAYPGECDLEVHVRDGRTVTELNCPQKVVDPAEETKFLSALSSIGVTWIRTVAVGG